MAVKVGINGFGRVAKNCLRGSIDHPGVEVVAVNSTRDPELLAHMLKYDSVYGTFEGEVDIRSNSLVVNGKEVPLLAQRDPSLLNWKETGAEVILEATGAFNNHKGASGHFEGGAKKVIITAPAKDADITLVMGVNEEKYDREKHHVISNSSCTTNCLAAVSKVLQQKAGIKHALMTTVHSYTNDQRLLDVSHKDFRRARAAGVSMIPTTTGAARNVGLVIPELEGKINGSAIRVPTFTVSIVDVVAELEGSFTAEDINNLFVEAASKDLSGYLDVSFEPLVSIDYKGNPYSAVVDALSTMMVDENMVKVLAWYDNEWGYCQRVLDLAEYVGQQGL